MSIVAIDIGASFIKSALVDLRSFEIKEFSRTPFPDFAARANASFREVPADDIALRVRAEIDRLRRRDRPIDGIALCAQMHGLVLCDERGAPHSDFVSWQDRRATEPYHAGATTFLDEIVSRLSTDDRQALGNETRAGLPVANLFWMSERTSLAAGAFAASLPDFVVARLCGTAPVTEPTLAASHGAFDLRRGDWHHDAIAKLGLASIVWPEVRPTGSQVATFDGIPVFTPIGDQQAALAGALLKPNELSINIATGSQVSRIAPKLSFGDHQVRPYFDEKYLFTVTHIPAGRSLNRLLALVTELSPTALSSDDAWAAVIEQAKRVATTDLKVDLAFFPSALGSRGSIRDLHEGNLSVGHLFRAAFQSMSDNYVSLAARLRPAVPFERLVFSGGLAKRIDLLRGLIADGFGMPFRTSPCDADTLLGLMALALHATGGAASVEAAIARLSEIDRLGHAWAS